MSDTTTELTRDQKLSKARNKAQSTILAKHRKEFDEEMVKEAAALGVEWAPRAKTAKEMALEQVQELLEKYPDLREQVVDSILGNEHDTLTLSDGAGPDHADPDSVAFEAARRTDGDTESRETKAWVAGALREGRVTADGSQFAYAVAGEVRRVPVDGENVKLIDED
jgi:hypothetical protein